MTAAVVFDFDGTIVDTEEPSFIGWSELWAAQGHELTVEMWQAAIGTHDGFDSWGELQRRVGRPLDPALLDVRFARKEALTDANAPRPGVLAWLDDADRLGVPVAIASSSPPDWIERQLARLGLRHRFRCIACCDGTLPAKPDPSSFRHACEQVGADPAASVAVEDSKHGVTAAAAAGLFTIAVPHGLTASMDFSAADLVVDSLDCLTLEDALSHAKARSGRENRT
ncbi:MAG: HAD-IA family hydrolase [Acidobacteria bacterium]|nr:HAD-IA family hydrolase [Acidobacteriota bacterium]